MMQPVTDEVPRVRPTERPDAAVLRDGRWRIQGGRCSGCRARAYPFAPTCSACRQDRVEVVDLATEGVVYAHSTVHVGQDAPYTLAYIDLDDGVRLLARVREQPSIGDRVTVVGTVGDAIVFGARS